MRILGYISATLFCLFALSPSMVADTARSAAIPAAIEAPANQELALTLKAHGVQVYQCRALPNDPTKFEWVLKGPEAGLFDAKGTRVGKHFKGPTWELNDGGKVVGKIKAKVDAPDGKGCPWLLLDAEQATGPIMGKVKSIQRVDTVGGIAPTDPLDKYDVNQEKWVKYSATYKFYVDKP
jgi:Protein of unknown function (DUF3455)